MEYSVTIPVRIHSTCANCGKEIYKRGELWFHVEKDRTLCAPTEAIPIPEKSSKKKEGRGC